MNTSTQDNLEQVDPYISQNYICKDCNFSRPTLWRLRKSGAFPEPELIGATKIQRWRLSTYLNWKEANREVQS